MLLNKADLKQQSASPPVALSWSQRGFGVGGGVGGGIIVEEVLV